MVVDRPGDLGRGRPRVDEIDREPYLRPGYDQILCSMS